VNFFESSPARLRRAAAASKERPILSLRASGHTGVAIEKLLFVLIFQSLHLFKIDCHIGIISTQGQQAF